MIRTLDFKPFENSISVSFPPRAAFGSGSLNINEKRLSESGKRSKWTMFFKTHDARVQRELR